MARVKERPVHARDLKPGMVVRRYADIKGPLNRAVADIDLLPGGRVRMRLAGRKFLVNLHQFSFVVVRDDG